MSKEELLKEAAIAAAAHQMTFQELSKSMNGMGFDGILDCGCKACKMYREVEKFRELVELLIERRREVESRATQRKRNGE